MKYSFYPGCAMTATGVEYGMSIRYVNSKIGMELISIPDSNCCGATAGHGKGEALGLALPARNVALCEGQNLNLPIAVACAACYSRMKTVTHHLRKGPEERSRMERLIEMPVEGKNDVLSILEVYSSPEAMNDIQQAITRQFEGLKVACYYGCLFARPTEVTGMENPDNPMMMDELVKLTGAEALSWDFKTECCGAAHNVDMPQNCKPLLNNIYRNARNYGAQAIITGCPLCAMNLDMRQSVINKEYGENFRMPVYYFTQLLALAMGAAPKEVGLEKHFVNPQDLVRAHLKERTAV